VTCPCAIGIATPLAVELAVAGLRRRGVLACSSGLLGKARHVRKILLDKTGTLTWGRVRVDVVRAPRPEARDLLLTLAAGSNHPVSRAIFDAVGAGSSFTYLPDLVRREVPGGGVEAVWRGDTWRLGSSVFTGGGFAGGTADDTTCRLTRDGKMEAEFRVREDLRANFSTEVARLAALGCELHVLSGDRQAKVDRIAAELGIPRSRAHGDMSPQAKADYVAKLDDADTMMLGDGLNDAPAFAAAYLAGTPALDRPVLPARADFCYAGGRPEAIGDVIAASRAFHRVVATNLTLGIAYNVIAVTLCLLGLMTPLLCAVLMPISSLALILHTTLRLRWRVAADEASQP
jgi:Cu2+-exporting ATPase